MPLDKANIYSELKKELLHHFAVSALVYRRNFFTWSKRDRQSYGEYVENLEEQFRMWVRSSLELDGEQEPTYQDLKRLLLRYRLDQALPEELNLFLIDHKVDDVDECADLADEFMLSRRVLQKPKGSGDGIKSGAYGRWRERSSLNADSSEIKSTAPPEHTAPSS
jgi:hypothetical protein